MCYSCHKIIWNRGGSDNDPPDWQKIQKATINPKNTNNKGFKYAIRVCLPHQEITNHSERVDNIRPFTKQFDLKGTNFPSNQKIWEKFERNNQKITVTLNV